jgi:hypothetical protein
MSRATRNGDWKGMDSHHRLQASLANNGKSAKLIERIQASLILPLTKKEAESETLVFTQTINTMLKDWFSSRKAKS